MKWLLTSWVVNALGFLQSCILSCCCCSSASGNCNEVNKSRIKVQLVDNRNPHRNAVKVTSEIWTARPGEGCTGADCLELGRTQGLEEGLAYQGNEERRKVWGGKWKAKWKGSVTKGLAPACTEYSRSRKWTRGTVRKRKLFLRDCFKGFLNAVSIYLFLPFSPKKKKDLLWAECIPTWTNTGLNRVPVWNPRRPNSWSLAATWVP